MMLKSKYILLIFLFLIGTQGFASQVLCDSLSTLNSQLTTDTIELADAEFEAWLEEYAQLSETRDTRHETQDILMENDSGSMSLEVAKDSVEKKDFVSLSKEGEEAREQEKNALIMSVMKSFKKRSEENAGTQHVASIGDTTVMEIDLIDTIKSIEVYEVKLLASNYSFIGADSLIAEIDSTLTTHNSQLTTQINPLFLDWVLGTESAVSMSLDDSDSVVVAVRKGAKDYVRAAALELYAYHKSQLPSILELQVERIQHDKRDKLLLNLDSLNRSKTSKLEVDLPEISKWSKGAKFQVHVSQNYISSNWYKGGESNMATTLYAMGYFNYDNRKGLQWDNKAEWKLGLYGMASDSLRWLRVNEDLLRLNSKLGYKAFKNFYYTAEWDFQTSLFNTYKSNTYIRTSGPFSPIRMSLSLGMDYKYKSIVSVFVSPLSYKLIYVVDMSYKEGVLPEENIAHQVGITDGTRQSNQLGALIRTDFDYDFNESIGMEVHFSFFGNYVGKIKGVEVGCEMIGNFKINRFLSAKVSLYPRYDSTTLPADGGKPKMQFYELISLGFNYKL